MIKNNNFEDKFKFQIGPLPVFKDFGNKCLRFFATIYGLSFAGNK